MTEGEMSELVLLRTRYGISATEYMTSLPWWEADLLLAAAGHDGGDNPAEAQGGRRLSAFSAAPELDL